MPNWPDRSRSDGNPTVSRPGSKLLFRRREAGVWPDSVAEDDKHWFALGSLEAPYLGSEDGTMGTDQQSKRPSTRRYTPAEKEQAVRLVRQLRKELGADQGTVGRVARQLGYGVESVRSWVKQADIDDGNKPGTITAEAERNQGAGAGEQGARAVQRDPSPGFGISRPGGARPPTEVTAPSSTRTGTSSGSSPSAGSCRWPRAPTTQRGPGLPRPSAARPHRPRRSERSTPMVSASARHSDQRVGRFEASSPT